MSSASSNFRLMASIYLFQKETVEIDYTAPNSERIFNFEIVLQGLHS